MIMSQSGVISGAHLDSLTQEPLWDSSGSCNHTYSADATSSSPHPQHGTLRLRSSGFPTAIAAPDPSLPSLLSSAPTPFPFFPYSKTNTPNFIFPPDCLTSTINLLLSPQAACLGILSVSSGHLWTSLIYYPKQKWHGISTGWLG